MNRNQKALSAHTAGVIHVLVDIPNEFTDEEQAHLLSAEAILIRHSAIRGREWWRNERLTADKTDLPKG